MLTLAQQTFLDDAVQQLSHVKGVVAIALGGSHARGTAGPDSDIDIAIYYDAAFPLDVHGIRQVAIQLSGNPDQQVTDLYAWGNWVNGGGWLSTPSGKVDLLYRELDKVRQTILNAREGLLEQDYLQQPAFGFYSVAYLEETRCCIPLSDPNNAIGPLKALVTPYPAALRDAVIQNHLWLAEFTLQWLDGFIARSDIYGAAGCMSRIGASLIQVLYAINGAYFLSDKAIRIDVPSFSYQPERFLLRLEEVLGCPGRTPLELSSSRDTMKQLHIEMKHLSTRIFGSG